MSTPAPVPVRERRRAVIRNEILAEAWVLCREHGLAGLSLRDLAARVGMRAPSLYSYFDSKDAIYDSMFRQGYEILERDYAPRIPDTGPPRTRLKEGAKVFFEFCTDDPVRYQLLFQRTIPGFVPSEESYAVAVRVLELLREELLGFGVDAPEHVDLWTGVLTGLVDQQISNDPGGDRWARLLEEAVDMYCDHVGIPPTRTRRKR